MARGVGGRDQGIVARRTGQGRVVLGPVSDHRPQDRHQGDGDRHGEAQPPGEGAPGRVFPGCRRSPRLPGRRRQPLRCRSGRLSRLPPCPPPSSPSAARYPIPGPGQFPDPCAHRKMPLAPMLQDSAQEYTGSVYPADGRAPSSDARVEVGPIGLDGDPQTLQHGPPGTQLGLRVGPLIELGQLLSELEHRRFESIRSHDLIEESAVPRRRQARTPRPGASPW